MLEKAFWIILSFAVGFALTVTTEDEDGLVPVPHRNIVRDGSCGENLTWTFDGETLRISGNGEMKEYAESSAIPWYSFQSSLKAVVIDEGVTTIATDCFRSFSELVSVVLPNSLLSIGNSSFYMCDNLTSVTIPDNVLTIGKTAFYGCDNLAWVKIPASVTSIGYQAFNGCERLETIEVDKNNKHFASIDGVLFDHECTTIIQYPIGNNSQSYTLPSTVRVIARVSFYGCRKLYSLNIPDSVTTIESSAFIFSYSLHTLVIPESVTSIGKSAFFSCSNLYALFYQGNTAISNEIFALTNNVETICVPPDYDGGSLFGGKNVTSDSTTCQQYQKMFNQCFKGSYVNYKLVQQKRKNATEWEMKTNGCAKYVCINETGGERTPIKSCNDGPACHKKIGQCNETIGECEYERNDGWKELKENHCYGIVCEGDEWVIQMRDNATDLEDKSTGCIEYACDNATGLIASALCDQMCIDGQCVQKDVENKVGVELELVDGVKVVAMDTTAIVNIISSQCNVDANGLTIGWEVDQQGFIIRITVYVEDKEIADSIAASVEQMDKGEGCQYGLLCDVKAVRVVGYDFLSDSIRIEVMTHLTVFLFLIIINNLSRFQFI